LGQRLVQVVAAIRASPQASLPKQCQGGAELAGAYRLLSNARVDPKAMQMPHRQRTAERCRDQATVLIVQDTTELDFSQRAARQSIRGVGPLGATDSGGAGLIQHAALAIDITGQTRGVAHQCWHCQQRSTPGETRTQRRERWTEADNWADAAHAVATLDFGSARLIHVGDRHSDVFDFLQTTGRLGHGYVVRAMHNRYIDDGESRLLEKLAEQPVAGTQRFDVPARSGPPRSKRQARQATLALRHCPLQLRPPKNDPRFVDAQPLAAWGVQLQEIDASADVEPIAWTLLTSEPVDTVADAWHIVELYRKRWVIEEWHRALKEGCRLEASRLDDARDVMRLAAILGPVAANLLEMRDLADRKPQADDPAVLQAVMPRLISHVAARLAKIDPAHMTPRQFWRLIARKGGHLGRKNDPRPGWKAIWDGWQQVNLMAQGLALAEGAADV
jgi:hypothetical protein